MLLACLSRRLRDRMPAALAFAAIPALAAAILAPGSAPLGSFPPPLRMTLTLDVPAAMLLGVAALLWMIAGIYAATYLRGKPNAGRFAEWWLLTLTGSLSIFMAADLVSFYLTYSVVSLAAYGLVVHDGTPGVRRAGAVYVALAVLGEAFLLMAFVFMAEATPNGSLLIRDAVAALPASPWRDASLALLILGFGLKIGLVPGHVWMPLAYTAAPIPAASALSGAAVKAGVIGLIRFLPLGAALPGWGEALAWAGFVSAFYGVAIGLTQRDPKTVLAYSSISQMGVIAAGLGFALAGSDQNAASDAAFYAANHVLVKAALFLSVGVAAALNRRGRSPALIVAAALALSLGGLPLTGGALAKLAIKGALGDGVAGAVAAASAAATTALMLHFFIRLARSDNDGKAASPQCVLSWLALAFASMLVPWLMFPAVGADLADALATATLWDAIWPMLIGAALAAGLWALGDPLPRIPAGDIVVAQEAALRASAPPLRAACERPDPRPRHRPAAGLSLLTIALALAAAGFHRP